MRSCEDVKLVLVCQQHDHYSFQIKESDHLYHIGILGGFAKASTGYSFLRAQNILQKIVSNIREGHDIIHDLPYQKMRFKKYDATLLDVLNDSKYTGEDLFINLFKKNPGSGDDSKYCVCVIYILTNDSSFSKKK